MYAQRIGLLPFPILEIFTPLGNLADIDFRVEIGSESLMVISSVTVYDIQILYLVEMMLRRISCVHTGNPRIETTSQDSGKTGFLETIFIGPLPAVLIFGFIERFVVGRI